MEDILDLDTGGEVEKGLAGSLHEQKKWGVACPCEWDIILPGDQA